MEITTLLIELVKLSNIDIWLLSILHTLLSKSVIGSNSKFSILYHHSCIICTVDILNMSGQLSVRSPQDYTPTH